MNRVHFTPRLPPRLVLGLAVLLPIAGASAAGAGQASSYTSHDWENCAEVPSPEEGVVQLFRCNGPAGIPVTYTGEEDGSSVGFGAKPLDEDYGFAGFFAVGRTVEWRGPDGGRPQAAIIRYRIGQSVSRLDRTVLVAYRLQPDGVGCIMATVAGGAGDNARARAVVDRDAAGFRCGTSRRVTVP